jgi:hypothetical protein
VGDFISIADLRRITGEPQHVINHAIARYGPEPSGRVGIIRVWRREDLGRILESLKKTARRSTSASRKEAATA